MKTCVVSFATPEYKWKMDRLEKSLKDVGYKGEFLGFTDYKEIGSPTHQELPYAFKAYAIYHVYTQYNYDLILWCDSPIVATKSLDPVFEHIENNGYLFFNNIGWSVGDYTNDRTLKHFNVTRDEAMNIPMIMACCMGFYAESFYIKDYYIRTNLFKGKWDNNDRTESEDPRCKGHRHDQSVMSLLIHAVKGTITTGHETYFAYEAHKSVLPCAESICLWSK